MFVHWKFYASQILVKAGAYPSGALQPTSQNDATSGLYYKTMTIVTDDSRFINKLEASLTDDARVVIYDCLMFIVQATGSSLSGANTLAYFGTLSPAN